MKRILQAMAALLLSASASAQTSYLGDFYLGDTVRCMWNSFDSSGASVTRSTDGSIVVYEDFGTTEITAAETDTEDFDSLTGVHAVSVAATSGNGFEAGKDYHIVLQGATIDSQTVNAALCSFSIENRVTQVTKLIGTAQGGAATSITLQAGATSTDDEVQYHWVHIVGGTGAGQTRLITTSNTTTEVATVNRAWDTDPDSTSVYIIPAGEIGYISADTSGVVSANMVQANGSTAPVDNIVDDYDGTGYNKSNSTMGTVTTLTGHTAQTGDSYALLNGANTELSAPPAVTANVVSMIKWLFTLSRNQIEQTASTQTLKNDALSGNIATSATSDDGTTFTRGEWE